MKTKSTKHAKTSSRKQSSQKAAAALATCPVNKAGWCAYPFSVAQLEKRLKRIAEESKAPQELTSSNR